MDVQDVVETAMAGNIETSRLQIIQSADIPNDPVRPRRLLILAGGVALGALMEIEGMVIENRGRLAVMNPAYTLLPHAA